jgi:hypothetical protein
MSRMDYFRQGGTPFDGFLYADLGQDRAGNTVSVLSALARLDRDPWDEAADLSALSNDGARDRLGQILSCFHDVPALGQDLAATILRLVALLPTANGAQGGLAMIMPATAKSFGIVPIVTAVIIGLLAVQSFILGSSGFGD